MLGGGIIKPGIIKPGIKSNKNEPKKIENQIEA